MSEHTPGPWITHVDDPETGWFTLTVFSANMLSHGQGIAEILEASDEDDEYKANGRLIAAAPDLLEALEAFVYAETENHEYGELADEIDGERLAGLYDAASKLARAAIRKAKGDT